MSSQAELSADATLDLLNVHGESPSPLPSQPQPDPPSPNGTNTEHDNSDNTKADAVSASSLGSNEQNDDNDEEDKPSTLLPASSSVTSLPFKATSLIRSLSDKIPHQIPKPKANLDSLSAFTSTPSKPPAMILKSVESPVSSNAASPQPPISMGGSNKSLNMTLDKFSKEDLFKLFGKARKENRALRQENETLKGKNRDLFKALNASSEQNEVLQVTNQHLREEYNSLKAKLASMNTASSEKHRKLQEELNTMRTTNEEKLSLIKTQAASYMDEINRLNEEIDQLKRENEKLHADNEGVQSKIGEQYSEFTIKINTLKQTINQLEKQMSEHGRERELFEAQIDDLKSQIATYDEQIAKYKDIARKAQTELDRIESLEEELRDKIRDNHQAQIKTRALNQNIEKLREKLSKQTHKIQQLEEHETESKSQLEQLQKDNESYKENNKLLNEKLNILLRENAESTLKTEHQIENIENYHLSKYKTLLKSFQSMKKRIDAQHKMKANHFNHNHSVGHASNAYSNQGWKKYHEDHAANFNLNASNMNAAVSSSGHKHLTYSIDLEMDEEEFMDNINDLNENISELSTPTSLRADDNTTKQLRKYKNQMKEYKHIISSLQTQMKDLRKSLEIERNTNKKFSEQTRRLNKPKNINIDYLRNVLVKFLILSEYLTDEQVVLVPVLGSILNLTKTEKEMIDNSYNSSRYFMGTV